MNHKLIPRKHRREATKLIDEFKQYVFKNSSAYNNWFEFLEYQQTGAMDGWLEYTDKKYKALQWLRQITSIVNKLNFLVEESE
ncbi:hypothetical protein AB4Y30_11605 [Ornithinibacillus sp. 4-3]|uniref:Uncharacterized protein n=1 Tax=Ornithinibacillus sp. 4-3 TaxID=3231488 RepID=A0AB39HLY1_9BACI